MALIGVLLGESRRVRLFPNVANLPLRPPAVLAKAAASLDLLSGGRFELGLGGGGRPAAAAMGGSQRSSGETVEAVRDAVDVIRAVWSGRRGVSVHGRHYTLDGLDKGPAPAHPISIWLGSMGPRTLRMRASWRTGGRRRFPTTCPMNGWPAHSASWTKGHERPGEIPAPTPDLQHSRNDHRRRCWERPAERFRAAAGRGGSLDRRAQRLGGSPPIRRLHPLAGSGDAGAGRAVRARGGPRRAGCCGERLAPQRLGGSSASRRGSVPQMRFLVPGMCLSPQDPITLSTGSRSRPLGVR